MSTSTMRVAAAANAATTTTAAAMKAGRLRMDAAMIHEQIKAIVGEPLNYVEGGIYQIILIDTNRCYVGRSVCVGGRLFDHVKALLLNKHINVKLQRA